MKYSLSRCTYKTSDEKFIKRYRETENDKVAREELIREIIEEGYVSNVNLDDDAYLDFDSRKDLEEALKEKGTEAEFDGKEIKAVWWELSEEKNDDVYDVDGFWKDEEMSLEESDEVAGIYRELDDVLLGRRK